MLTSIVMTPWVNFDSLTILKFILVFSTGAFLIPYIWSNRKMLVANRLLQFLSILSFLIVLQLSLVLLFSGSPLTQQLFGRGGRALGFITQISFIVIMLSASIYSQVTNKHKVVLGLIISSLISSVYSILQFLGLDIFNWTSRTNGIIGTLGNPNFQSSFAALALIPTFLATYDKKSLIRKTFSILSVMILVLTVYICESTQGYVISFASVIILILFKTKFSNIRLFILASISFSILIIVSILGMLDKGLLASFLYKPSVTSRGEFWRSAIAAANDNPLFGVGIDSFADKYLLYRSPKDINGINEFADNAHNYFLEYAATGGYILAILYSLLLILALMSIFKIFARDKNVDNLSLALLISWLCIQMQSLISPGNIVIMLWNFVITGTLIGLATKSPQHIENSQKDQKQKINYRISSLSAIIAIIISIPYFQADRLQLQSLNLRDAELAVSAAKMFPESSVRYTLIGLELRKSNLLQLSLDVGKSAVRFNPNSISGWSLIALNDFATLIERNHALDQMIRLNPLDDKIKEYKKELNAVN